MSVLRIDGTSPECVEHVVRRLKEIGNIGCFSAFSGNVPLPYADVPGSSISLEGERQDAYATYRLILKNADSDQEVWIELNGPEDDRANGTVEILQLLGARLDYRRIAEEQAILNETIQVEHQLNFIILHKQGEDEGDILNHGKIMKVMMRFGSPFDKWKTKEMLSVLGRIEPLRQVGGEEAESYYFRTPFDTRQELPRCTTNNVLTLHPRFDGSDAETIHKLVQQIAEDSHAELTTRLYEKAPQG